MPKHLTGIPWGSALPTDTLAFGDGYPFLLDGVLHVLVSGEWVQTPTYFPIEAVLPDVTQYGDGYPVYVDGVLYVSSGGAWVAVTEFNWADFPSGTALPDPVGYDEGYPFIVTASGSEALYIIVNGAWVEVGGGGGGGGTSTIFVAASNARPKEIAGADYECDGTNDEVQIRAAIADVGANGTVELSSGTFNIDDPITIGNGKVVRGQGRETLVFGTLTLAGVFDGYIFTTGVPPTATDGSVRFERFRIDNETSDDAAIHIDTQPYLELVEMQFEGARAPLSTWAVQRVLIDRCRFLGGEVNAQVHSSTGLAVVRDSYFDTVGGDGTALLCNGHRSEVINNHFVESGQVSVNGNECHVVGNVTRNGRYYGFEIRAAGLVANNQVIGANGRVAASVSALRLYNDNIHVVGNRLRMKTGYEPAYGMQIVGTPQGIWIVGNDFLASGTSADLYDPNDVTTVVANIYGEGPTLPLDNVVGVTAAYTVGTLEEVVLADASGAAFTVTLPAPTLGARATVKKVDASANAVTVATPGTETIDGAADRSLAAENEVVRLVSDGANWFVV